MEEFELEIESDSEDHKYALDLIENLVEVSRKDGLPPGILMEVAMVYSLGFNLTHGDRELVHKLLSSALEQLGEDSAVAESIDPVVH